MNTKQKSLFDHITTNLEKQQRGDEGRVRLFTSGNAGTGKTFTLNLIRDQIRCCYGRSDAVRVCAFTGAASNLISGQTLHSAFKIPVKNSLVPLSGACLAQMQKLWQHCKVLIIDEISSVSHEMLCIIDSRLKQIFNSSEIFGNINILLFGDLFQLPPVSGHAVFEIEHLWREFAFCELTENMRQREDCTFIDILNNLRVGKLTANQVSILRSKMTDLDGKFSIGGEAIRIVPTNQQVDDHNAAAVEFHRKQGVQMVSVRAKDRIMHRRKNTGKHGCLPKTLTLFINAKVMLLYNINTEAGLTNGAIGIITDIQLPTVKVKFDRIEVEHTIALLTLQMWSYRTLIERTMLPLKLCFASTVHKMQGSTVSYGVLDLGSKNFAPGQSYVALSRVTSLNGVRIEDLDTSKLSVCNVPALNEMRRLRKTFPQF